MLVSEFDYLLPPELIAQYPAEARDQARLMVVDRQTQRITHTTFDRLGDLLEASDVVVVNDTKVIPARLQGTKRGSGGSVEVFLLRELQPATWEALFGGKVKPGGVIVFGDGRMCGTVVTKAADGKGVIEFAPVADLKTSLYELGRVPLPPYIKRPDGVTADDPDRYQTVYAAHEGAVAAPTAGLHFSETLLAALQRKGIDIIPVTLHVGIGTFQPVKVAEVEAHRIHPEWYALTESAARRINKALASGQRLIAVGTTSTRLLEAVYAAHGAIQTGAGWADIFIYPGFQFQVTNALITNFHLPKSSLIMLVAAFGGVELVRQAYREAIQQRYRFYSYGDAMLLI